jgi:hypothetical protein
MARLGRAGLMARLGRAGRAGKRSHSTLSPLRRLDPWPSCRISAFIDGSKGPNVNEVGRRVFRMVMVTIFTGLLFGTASALTVLSAGLGPIAAGLAYSIGGSLGLLAGAALLLAQGGLAGPDDA